jgi:hypothetical protein
MKKILNPYSFYSIVFIALVISILKLNYHQRNIFAYDNYGYYLYLPAAFIYHDLSIADLDKYKALNEKYQNTPTFYQLMQSPKGKIIIRMYMGTAILLSPAFFAGHTFALITGMPADGFSPPYQWAVLIYGLLLTLTGIVFARKLLLNFFNDKVTALTLLLTYLGTNLFFFAALGNPIPHVYLFNIYIFLLYFTVRWHKEQKWLYAAGIGISLGLILAIRPSEIIAILIPILYNIYDQKSLNEKTALFTKRYPQIILGALLVTAFILPQFIYWRIIAGEFVVSIYNDPSSKMNWFYPRFLNTLFSFRKGWFIYSPLSILAIVGIFMAIRKHKPIFLFTIIFIALNIYMISCFSSLISYGYRAFIQSYAILLIPLAVLIERLLASRKWIISLSLLILTIFIYLNIILAKHTLLETVDGSRMTKASYLAVLGKYNAKKPEELFLTKRTGYTLDTLTNTEQYRKTQLIYFDFENNGTDNSFTIDSTIKYNGKFSLRMDSTTSVYSPGIKTSFKDLDFNDHFWIKASVKLYSNDSLLASKGNLVIASVHKYDLAKYRAIHMSMLKTPFKTGEWNTIEFDYISPEFLPEDAELQIYFWNDSKSTVWIDELKADIFKLKEE